MNINTQIPNFNYVNNNQIRNNKNKTTNFKGLNKKTGEEVLKLAENQIKTKKPNKFLSHFIDFIQNPVETIKLKVFNKKLLKEQINDRNYDIAFFLKLPPQKIEKLTRGASLKRLTLLDLIAERNNTMNYVNNSGSAENALKLFESIPYPKKGHYNLVSSYPGSIENLQRIVNATGNNKKSLNFVNKLNHEVISANGPKTTARPELAAELLESKNAQKYIENFADYKSYLTLNAKNENAVKNLDKMVEEGSFNPKKYDIELDVAHLFDSKAFPETAVLNKKAFEENYSKEGLEFIDNFAKQIGLSNDNFNTNSEKDILHIYKTTTKENLDIRNKIIENITYHKFIDRNIHLKKDETAEIAELFDKVDNDKHAKSFISKIIDSNIVIKSANEYNNMLDNVPPKKLNIFFDNAKNIIQQTSGKERIDALKKEIKNPFFKTEQMLEYEEDQIEFGFKKKTHFFSDAKKYIINEFNKTRDKMTSDEVKPLVKHEIKEVEKVESKPVINIIEPIELPKAEEVKPVVDIDFKAVEKVKPEEIVNVIKPIELPKANEVKPIIEVGSKEINKTKPAAKRIKLVKIAPKQPDAKKLAVINDVNNIIEKKLGAKTLIEQKRDYANRANKMRLNMLPEIFASIKETRAADRANGIKSKYSNQDALHLYEKINGKNRKLVNYMLKKRNADGTRKFNIKDIITTLEDTEQQVINNKKVARKIYDKQSERNLYNNIFNTNVAVYGKLERTTKQK